MNRAHRFRLILGGTAALTLGLGVALYFNWIPLLQGGYGWDWHYRPPRLQNWLQLIPFFAAALVYVAGVWWLRRARLRIYLAWVLAAGMGVCTAALGAYGNPLHVLYERTVSANATGAFLVGVEFPDLIEGVRRWPEDIAGERYSGFRHMRLSPPGLPALYWLSGQVMEQFPSASRPVAQDLRSYFCDQPQVVRLSDGRLAASIFGLLAPLWAMLVILPLAAIGRSLRGQAGDPVIRLVTTAWVLVPAVPSFLGSHNTIFPLAATLSLAAFVRGWRSEHPGRALGWLAAAGLGTAVCLALNVSMIPLTLFLGLLTLFWTAEDAPIISPAFWRRSIGTGVQYGLGLAAGLLLYRLATHHFLWDLMETIMPLHLELDRPYAPWVGLHTRDVFLFFGLPFFCLWLFSCAALPAGLVKKWGQALLATLVILILSGTARGEVGRVWMFFMPAMLLPVGEIVWLVASRRQTAAVAGLQAGWLVVGLVVLQPLLSDQAIPPAYDAVRFEAFADAPAVPIFARFGDEFILQWFQARPDPARNEIVVNLAWSPLRQVDASYLFSALAVAEDGRVVGKTTWLPLDYRYPTSCWHLVAEPPVIDQIPLEIEEPVARGAIWLSLSAFLLPQDSEPRYLPVVSSQGIQDDQIGLGPIAWSPAPLEK